MPRFYFDLQSKDRLFCDAKGSELSDTRSARDEALTVLPDIVRAMWVSGEQNAVVTSVRDASGEVVFGVQLSLILPLGEDAGLP